MITYLSLNDYKNTSHAFAEKDFNSALEYYKKTILHEFVHFVNELFYSIMQCPYTEKYLVEGIATYLSEQKANSHLSFNFTLEDILVKKNFSSCYDGWYLLTNFLIENYDKGFVLSLFQSSHKAREFLETELFDKAQIYYNKNKFDKDIQSEKNKLF